MGKILPLLILAVFSASAQAYDSVSAFDSLIPPKYYTGSPNSEGQTCGKSGCHTGTLSSGSVFDLIAPQLVWSSNNQAFLYTPGQTYDMIVKLKEDRGTGTNLDQNGFALEILDSSNSPAGLFTTDISTKLSADGSVIMDADNATARMTTWTFKWTAPSPGSGTLFFYGAAVDGDGDGQANSGDISDHGFTQFMETGVTNPPSSGCGLLNVYGGNSGIFACMTLFSILFCVYRRRKFKKDGSKINPSIAG